MPLQAMQWSKNMVPPLTLRYFALGSSASCLFYPTQPVQPHITS